MRNKTRNHPNSPPKALRTALLLVGTALALATAAQAAAPTTASGTIKAKGFLNIGGGTAVTDLNGNAKFPDKPDVVYYYPYFEWNATGDIATAPGNYGDNYGDQLTGYFYPPATGDYTFYISADDNAALYLSTDDDPANKKLIARESIWSNAREYTTSGGSSDLTAKDSSQFTQTEWTSKSAAGGAKITLTKGKAYYIETLHKEGGGGDNLSVAVQAPDGSIDSTQPIPGKYLSPFAPASSATILVQPQDAAVYAGGIANFSVGLELPPGVSVSSIKWQKNGTDVPNSNATSLSLPVVAGDNGGKIKAVISTSAGGTLTSSEANLSVATFSNEFAPGVVKFEAYTDIGGGTAVNDLITNDKFTAHKPDDVRLIAGIDSPNGYGDNYGAEVSGFIVPPETASYYFFLRSDDASQLWLSKDDNAANANLIAEETGCCQAFLEPDSSVTGWHDNGLGMGQTTLTPISLTAGKKYAFYVYLKEGGGGDYVQVAARKQGDATPAAGLPALAGSWVGANAKPSLGDPQIITQPQAPARVIEGQTVRLTVDGQVTPTGYNYPLLIQWQKDGKDIAGAMSKTYIIPSASAADSGTYHVNLGAPSGKSVTSTDAVINVVPDTFPPEIVKAGSLIKGSAVEIGILFDEAVDPTTGGAAANYTLSKGTVTGVRYEKYAHEGEAPKFVLGTTGSFQGYSVVLTTSGLAAGDATTVTVKNLKDLKGNAMAAAGVSKDLTVTKKMKWAAMGGTDYLDGVIPADQPDIKPLAALWPDDAAAYSEKDFDLISGGQGNWANYDETTFVYEEVTGDFDKVVRVEYQDPTSQWARAGLCATPSADEGITRAQVDAGYAMAQRFMQRANPAVQWSGAAGNNQNEYDYRAIAGGAYGGGGGGTPAYPNAWLRMQRKGQTFSAFYSSDAKNWTQYGTYTFTDVPDTSAKMPDKLLVGPYYSPEMNNNTTGQGVGHSTLARFRDYGDFGASSAEPTVSIATGTGGKITITFTGGKLQMATKLGDSTAWKEVTGATSPYEVPTNGAAEQFYRVAGQ